MSGHSLRIALIAAARYPIREPFAGGLEAHTWALADGLRRRGHHVSLFAAPGSDPRLGATHLPVRQLRVSVAAAADPTMPASAWLAEHHAYLSLMLELMDCTRYDIVHNNSLHHLPVAMARAVATPQVTTLHTPPTPWLESAIASAPCPVRFVAVSRFTAAAWRHVVPQARVVRNGADVASWRPGPGGRTLVWVGRMIAEKGPDLAIAAARQAGVGLRLAGPISDRGFFDHRVAPQLGDGIDYVGHLCHADLTRLVGASSAALVTPRWDEPYGLVAAEALACGTPVLGFARGGLPEVVDRRSATLVAPDDVPSLAAAITRRGQLDRQAARRRAERHCSLPRMIGEYERLYTELVA